MGRSQNDSGIKRSRQLISLRILGLSRSLLVVLLVQASLSSVFLLWAHAQSLVPRINQPAIGQAKLQAMEQGSGSALADTIAPQMGDACFLVSMPTQFELTHTWLGRD